MTRFCCKCRIRLRSSRGLWMVYGVFLPVLCFIRSLYLYIFFGRLRFQLHSHPSLAVVYRILVSIIIVTVGQFIIRSSSGFLYIWPSSNTVRPTGLFCVLILHISKTNGYHCAVCGFIADSWVIAIGLVRVQSPIYRVIRPVSADSCCQNSFIP